VGGVILLFEDQLDDVGEGLDHPAQAEAQDVGAVGAEAVLDEAADPTFQPDQHRDHQQRQQRRQDDGGEGHEDGGKAHRRSFR